MVLIPSNKIVDVDIDFVGSISISKTLER